MLNASASTAFSGPHHAEEGRAQPSGKFTTAELTVAIRDLRMVVNPDTRVQMLVQIVQHHGLDNPDVVALALAELEQTRCSGPVSRAARAQLQPRPTPLWHSSSQKATAASAKGRQRTGETRPEIDQSQTKTEVEMRLDPELGRLAIGLHKAALLRLWVIGRYLSTTSHSGRGWLDLDDFWAALAPLGVLYTRRHFRRLVRAGEGVFWTCTYNRIYFSGVGRLAGWLTACAVNQQPDLVATNRPGGMKDVVLPVAGSLERWEGLIYAGWLAAKENPIIARDTLATLFGRTVKTIRQWERDRLQHIVTHRPCYAQVADPQANTAFIPEHSYAYVASTHTPGQWQVQHQIRIRWRLPNVYMSVIRQHPRRGQSRKVRTISNTILELQPLIETAEGLPRNPRRYFETAKHVRQVVRRYGAGERYLFLGRDRCDHNIFEPTEDGYPMTRAGERVKTRQERWLLGMI